MYVTLQNNAAIRPHAGGFSGLTLHSSPERFLGSLTPTQARHLLAGSTAAEIVARGERVLRDTTTADKGGKWSDADRRRVNAKLKQRRDDELRRETAKKLKARARETDLEFRRDMANRIQEHRRRAGIEPAKDDKPKRSHSDLYSTAFHEAGHAFYAVYEGMPVNWATIIPNGSNAGSCLYDRGPRWSEIRSCVAGPVSQSFWAGEKTWKPWVLSLGGGELGDLELLDDLFHASRADVQAAIEEVTPIIRKFWGCIAELADLLIQKKTIEGPEIHAVVDKHLAAAQRKEGCR